MFQRTDFKVFDEPTLSGRMALIRSQIDPSFESIAPAVIQTIEQVTGQTTYAHIAKHLRRYKNPPTDTWVAFSQNKRGYKGYPHIEIGYWPECLFVYWDLLDEAKKAYLPVIDKQQLLNQLIGLPADFVVSNDHTSWGMQPLNDMTARQSVDNLFEFKHRELVIGRYFLPTNELFDRPAELQATILAAVQTLTAIKI